MAQESFDSLAAAVMQAESRGQRFDAKGQLTTSSKGAEGEMQVMPRTQVRPGYGVAPAQDKSPQEIARVGKDYLKAMLDKYGEREKALIAYNWGPGNTDKWLEGGGDLKKLPAETKSYVAKVDSILSGVGAKSVVREDVQPMMEKALQSGQTAAAPQAAPTSSKLEAMGPSYQAALALAMLSSEDEREGRDPEDKDNEEKTAEARKWLEDMQEMESGPRPTALAGLELNSLNAFAQPQAAQARPQGMAAGGVPYTPTAMASSAARDQLAQLKAYDTKAKGYNASLDKYNKDFYEPYVANVNKYNAQIAAGNTNPDSFYTPAPFDMPAPKAPMDQAQQTQFMANTKKDVANRQLALNVAADPEQYGLSMGKFFADGGAVYRAEGSPPEGELSAEEIERYSRPAFVTPGSGIGRKEGNISEGLASGEGYREAAKGLTMMPANLAGAPADLYNFTVRRAMGTDVDKPVGGSENIKEFLRDKGLAFKPPEDPKLKGFFEAGDLASNLINPAAVTRGVASGAAKAGQAVGSAAKQLKEMGRPASVAEAVPTYRPQDTIDEITRATGVAPPANPDGWNVIDVGGELPSSPVQLLNIAPANRVAPPVGLPPPDYLPNGVRPFVGKLDAFVDEMKNPVRLDQFMGQIQGKFRSYDIERVERAFEGMDPKTKLTPDQIKQALDKNYSPSKWVSETIPPNPDRNPHGEVDNVWKVPLGTTNLYLEQPASSIEAAGAFSLVLNKLRPLVRIGDLAPTVKDLAVARETLSNKAVLNNADPKIINELSTKIDKVEKNVQLMQDLMGSVKNINRGFVEPTAYVDAVAAGKGNTFSDQPYWKFHNEAFYNELTAKVDQARARAIANGKSPERAADAAIAVYEDEALRINANKNAEIIAIKKVHELALKEAARLDIPAPDFSLINWSAQDGKSNAWLKTGDNLPFKVSVDLVLEPSFQTLNEQSKKVKRYLAKDVGDLQASMTLPNLETGKHQAVAGKPYPIAFTRFSEHEAVIDPSIGKVQGRHFHELQSDLYNALTKKGAVTSSASKDAKEIKELDQQYAKHQDAMVAETRKLGPLPLSSEPMSPEYWAKRDVIDKKFKESVQGIEQRKKILTDRVALYGDTNKTADYSVQEPFAGFEKGSDLRRQMLIKNAVYSSMHDGKSFATFPGAESSKSELYVGKIYPNLKQVAKDLGGQKAELKVRQIKLPPDAKGNPVTAWGIAWSPETAARIVKQGVPFAKGGMVERETADNRKYL